MHAEKIGSTQNSLQRQLSDEIRRRQLDELGVIATSAELRVFGEHGSCSGAWTAAECRMFEGLLLRVFEANKSALIFNQGVLVNMGAMHFRGTCRYLLVSGNKAGMYYWKSRIRSLDSPTLRQLAGLIWRSGAYGLMRRPC
jgi:hypothetical protein